MHLVKLSGMHLRAHKASKAHQRGALAAAASSAPILATSSICSPTHGLLIAFGRRLITAGQPARRPASEGNNMNAV
jgi:hypothetical protein